MNFITKIMKKQENSKLCIGPLAWNFFDEIKKRVEAQGINKCLFLKYFPSNFLSILDFNFF